MVHGRRGLGGHQDVPDRALVVGNPARVVGYMDEKGKSNGSREDNRTNEVDPLASDLIALLIAFVFHPVRMDPGLSLCF